MSYGTASALQAAVYQALAADAALASLVGSAIHDELPPGPVAGTYVSLGEGEVRDLSDKTGAMAEHRFTISVTSDAEGFATAKAAAGAVSDVLIHGALTLVRGQVVSLRFVKARERRVRSGQVRRIELTFRAIVDDA